MNIMQRPLVNTWGSAEVRKAHFKAWCCELQGSRIAPNAAHLGMTSKNKICMLAMQGGTGDIPNGGVVSAS